MYACVCIYIYIHTLIHIHIHVYKLVSWFIHASYIIYHLSCTCCNVCNVL